MAAQEVNSNAGRKKPLLIGGGVLLLLLILIAVLSFLMRRPADNPTGTLYLIDSSARMGGPFGEGQISMLSAAQGFVRDIVSRSPSTSIIGVRVFGGGYDEDGCQDTALVVQPAPGTQALITAELEQLRPVSSEAALIASSVAAIRDLAAIDNAGRLRLVIITGGSGTCLAQNQDLIQREANRENIELETIIINIGPDDRDVLALRSFAEELGNAVVVDATTEESLAEIGEAIEEGGIEEVATRVGQLPTPVRPTPIPSVTPTLPPPPTIEPTSSPTTAPTSTVVPSPNPSSTPTAPPAPTSTPTFAPPRATFTPTPSPTPSATPPPISPSNTPLPPPTSTPSATPRIIPPTPTPTTTLIPSPTATATSSSAPSLPAITIQDATVWESPNAVALVRVVLDKPPTTGDVSVSFSTVEGSAASIIDFSPVNGTLTWSQNNYGVLYRDILINIRNDDTNESTETFGIQLSNPVNATLARSSGTVTIFDDDASSIPFVQQHFFVEETVGQVNIQLRLGSQPSSPVRIPIVNANRVSKCTIPVTEVVLDASNFTGVTIPVTIIDDTVVDGVPSVHCWLQTLPAISGDPIYNGQNPADFNIFIFDNEALYVTDQCTKLLSSQGCDEESLVYRTVQTAVDAATAGRNTIFLDQGVYTENNITLNRNVILRGAGPDLSILQGAAGPQQAAHRVLFIPPGQNVTIQDLTVRYGHAPGENGGGIRSSGQLALLNVLLDQNFAALGGGLYSDGGLFINRATLSGNTAGAGSGGGLFTDGGGELRNVTISSNNGGGLATNGASPVLKNVTVAANSGGGFSGSVTSQNSLFAGNSPQDCLGTLFSQGFNLVENGSGCTVTPAGLDQVGVSAPLGGLADNGGGLPTHLLLGGNPAINGGSSAPVSSGGSGGSCLAVDQRGVSRPQDGRCDIGSVEMQP